MPQHYKMQCQISASGDDNVIMDLWIKLISKLYIKIYKADLS